MIAFCICHIFCKHAHIVCLYHMMWYNCRCSWFILYLVIRFHVTVRRYNLCVMQGMQELSALPVRLELHIDLPDIFYLLCIGKQGKLDCYLIFIDDIDVFLQQQVKCTLHIAIQHIFYRNNCILTRFVRTELFEHIVNCRTIKRF